MTSARAAASRLAGALLLVLLAASLNLPLQRTPIPIAAGALAVLVLTLLRERTGLLLALVLVPLVPVLGNLLRGPWVAPGEVVFLAALAAVLLRGPAPEAAPRTGLGASLALASAAAVTGGVAALLVAVPAWAVPGALLDLVHVFYGGGPNDAAFPVRAALVHAAGLAAYLLARRLLRAVEPTRVATALVLSMTAVSAYGVIEAASGLKLWPEVRYDPFAGFLRVCATLSDHNALGSLLALFLFPSLALAIWGAGRRRALGVVATPLLLATFLLSGSRTAWLSFAGLLLVSVVVLAVARRGRDAGGVSVRILAAAAASVALGVWAVVVAWPGPTGELLRSRVASAISPSRAVETGRLGRGGFWRAGGRMIAANPLFGVGPGRVPARFAEYRDPSFAVREESLHSYPMQLVAELGAPGGLLLLAPFLAAGALAVRASRASRAGPLHVSPRPEVVALAPGIGACLLTGLASHPWLLAEVQVVFWAAVATLEAELGRALPARRSLSPSMSAGLRRPWSAVAATALVVWGVARIALAPGTERGRFTFGDWGAEPSAPFRWLGPRALFRVEGGAAARGSPRGSSLSVSVRRGTPLEGPPQRVRLRAAGGPFVEAVLADGDWHEVAVPYSGGGERPVDVEARSNGAICPDADASHSPGDRRILSFHLKSR